MESYPNTPSIAYAPTEPSAEYPESDGKPMAETEEHRDELMLALQTLIPHFAKIPDVCVSGNLMMYYVAGNPRYSISPDLFVTFGVARKKRRIYKIWEEGKPPDFVLEFSSKNTFRHDLRDKKALYASLGVAEYFLYDADGLYLPSPLMGFRLVSGVYVPIAARADGSVPAETLGLDLHVRETGLRFYDPVAQMWLPTPAEAAQQRADAAEQRGIEQGIEQGETRAKQMALLKLLRFRFDPIPQALTHQIRSIQSLALLDMLFEQVLSAQTLEDINWQNHKGG